jgi:hypothetical protein
VTMMLMMILRTNRRGGEDDGDSHDGTAARPGRAQRTRLALNAGGYTQLGHHFRGEPARRALTNLHHSVAEAVIEAQAARPHLPHRRPHLHTPRATHHKPTTTERAHGRQD